MHFIERYRHFKTWQLKAFDWDFDKNEHHHCVNCENDFVGNYCPHCSQKAHMGKVSWKSVMQGIAEVWGMNTRSLPYSLWQLMFRPGYFISEYINGKRQVSFPPVKMLVIMGVISLIVDHLFTIQKTTPRVINSNSPLIDQYFAWLETCPGWGWLSIVCFFLIPTWCLFRYSPKNAKHSLPQGFFIQVFMSIQALIVDDLADFFTDYFYIMIPMCYLYTYRQLFGYRLWGNVWRVLLMISTGFSFALFTVSVIELFTINKQTTFSEQFSLLAMLLLYSTAPMLAGMLISKIFARRQRSKLSQSES